MGGRHVGSGERAAAGASWPRRGADNAHERAEHRSVVRNSTARSVRVCARWGERRASPGCRQFVTEARIGLVERDPIRLGDGRVLCSRHDVEAVSSRPDVSASPTLRAPPGQPHREGRADDQDGRLDWRNLDSTHPISDEGGHTNDQCDDRCQASPASDETEGQSKRENQ